MKRVFFLYIFTFNWNLVTTSRASVFAIYVIEFEFMRPIVGSHNKKLFTLRTIC
jgi:hypothetical protein